MAPVKVQLAGAAKAASPRGRRRACAQSVLGKKKGMLLCLYQQAIGAITVPVEETGDVCTIGSGIWPTM